MLNIAATAVGFALLSATTNPHLSNLTTAAAQPASHSAHQQAPAHTTKPAPAEQTAPTPVTVTVQPGDTLSSIANAQGTTYVRIFDANDELTDPNVITPGQQLRIPTADETLPDRMASVTAPAPATATTYVSRSTTPVATVAAAYPVSNDAAKAFIYAHESGNNPNATSPNGCYGLGQDCNGRVRALCGADYVCQDAYFTNYALSRYGSWAAAEAFWQAHHWW